MPDLILVTHTPAAGDACAEAAALAVAATGGRRAGERAALLIDAAARRQWRDTLLATDAARALARGAVTSRAEPAAGGGLQVRVRGRIAIAAMGPDPEEAIRMLAVTADCGSQRVLSLRPEHFRTVLEEVPAGAASALVRGRPADRPLAGAVAVELRARRVPHKIWLGGLGTIGAGRARAGLEPGGPAGARARSLYAALGEPPAAAPIRQSSADALKRRLRAGSETGQALPALLGLVAVVLVLAAALVAVGGAATAKGRAQRAADLAAVSAARSMRDDFGRLFIPARRADGRPDPGHLGRGEYLRRGRAAAREAARRNGLDPGSMSIEFPDRDSFAPLRVEVRGRVLIRVEGGGPRRPRRTRVRAAAGLEPAEPDAAAGPAGPAVGSGGGFSGPLVYRQGEPMRPDVAAAFDRLSRAASAAGHALVVNSGFRSDAEQAELFAANPDPRWVAPPGRSLHRCGTELDLGPPAAYGWLAANAGRFGFTLRYSWEPWHFGYDDGPAPCSPGGERLQPAGSAGGRGDGRAGGSAGLPGFVPAFARDPLFAAAARHDVSAALLAAQLLAESNFNPAAVSPAGARGIAQFMPATAAAYGLEDPFDPAAAIAAQARLMSDLLDRFGSVALALAAYNAGPGAVSACGCIPPYPETQAYVARILGILGGSGETPGSAPAPLEVRLLE